MDATPPRSALLAAWGNAWLAGEAALEEVAGRVTAYDDAHDVTGLWVDDLPVEQALGRLRADGVTRLRVVLPAPGDVLGLPGPGPFTTAAVAASEGVLALRPDGTGTGLVPAVTAHGSEFDGTVTTVQWSAYAVQVAGPDPGPFLHDAEHDLRRGVAECVQVLRDLDVARWRPEVGDALKALRDQARRGLDEDELPDSYPVRARQVLVQARQLAAVLQLAAEDSGGAVDTRETAEREQALRRLGGLVRRARVAAYNAHGLA
ncbi:MAG: hypothetical protein LC789_01005 [Actinobacteria bacterium]|nr:hypothetical protein [Actinomycetota bacterium]MCA1722126.1 hypothetical protein [Actinomycetota bacterium]